MKGAWLRLKSFAQNYRLYAILALVIFVFLDNYIPFDPRVHMGFKRFEIDWSLDPASLLKSLSKWKHVLWFAIFFPLAQGAGPKARRQSWAILLGMSVLIELQQTVIAGRHARLLDLLPNLIGAALGAWIARKVA